MKTFLIAGVCALASCHAAGQGSDLTIGAVRQALASLGFVSGQVVEIGRPYLLERLTIQAKGSGEFVVTFKARAQ